MGKNQLTSLIKKKFRPGEVIAESIITLVSFVSFAFIILIFVFVFREALPFFIASEGDQVSVTDEYTQETYGDVENNVIDSQRQMLKEEKEEVGWSNILSTQWQPVSLKPRYGIFPLVLGSLKVSLIAVFIAAPIAILAALFTSSFAPKWARETFKPAIELLAGFPTVVIGFFALMVLASWFQDTFGYMFRLNSFIGGVALALTIIPVIYTITEDALSTVPKTYSEASLALGATKWQTTLFVIFPAAIPGIFAAVLLGIGRAFGETMIVLMATGNSAIMSLDPFDPVRTMSATIGAEMAEVVFGETHYNVLFLLGSILFVFTFIMNVIAEFYIRRRLIKRFRGG